MWRGGRREGKDFPHFHTPQTGPELPRPWSPFERRNVRGYQSILSTVDTVCGEGYLKKLVRGLARWLNDSLCQPHP